MCTRDWNEILDVAHNSFDEDKLAQIKQLPSCFFWDNYAVWVTIWIWASSCSNKAVFKKKALTTLLSRGKISTQKIGTVSGASHKKINIGSTIADLAIPAGRVI